MRWSGLVALLAIAEVSAGPQPKTQITIWAAAAPVGGATYGTGVAMIFELREIDVAANGEARISNIAGTADPLSIQVRDLTDPKASITEQRFLPAPKTATEMIARRIGEPVTVVTPKGDVSGVLLSIDETNLALEIGSGDARRVAVMRREYALDVRLTGAATDKPGVTWRLATAKPGKHAIELAYRAEGLSWSVAYLAVLDEPGTLVDFTARATIRNVSGATFDNANITLIGGSPLALAIKKPAAPPSRFTLPHAVKLTGDTVQLELLRVAGAKARSVISYEAIPDPLITEAIESPGIDCSSNNGTADDGGSAEATLEIDIPTQTALPDGPVQIFRRRGRELDALGDDPLRSAPGVVRLKVAASTDVTGERKALSCTVDEKAHTIHERLEVRVENKSAKPVDVIAREFMWRWPVWRAENESKKGARAAAQTQEYRLRINPRSSQTVTYTAVYTW